MPNAFVGRKHGGDHSDGASGQKAPRSKSARAADDPEKKGVLRRVKDVEICVQIMYGTISFCLGKKELAELYIMNAQHEGALALYADSLKLETFDLITKYNLQDAVHDKVVLLVLLDSKRAISLFMEHRFPPSEVISQMMAANEKCNSRYFTHLYLRSLFDCPYAGKEFHDLQLYAEYEPEMLLLFLRSSMHYNLDKAYEICLKRDLLREQVFLLGRLGNTKKSLSVNINKLEDIQEAIDFISRQHDDELWEELVKQCLRKPEMVGVLLENTVGNLDPLYIVKSVPNGLQIPW